MESRLSPWGLPLPTLTPCLHGQEAKAKQEKVSAQYLSEIEMAKAQRDYELKKAAYDIEVNTRRAQADLAYQLQVRAPMLARWPGWTSLPPRSSQATTLSHILTLIPLFWPSISDPTPPYEEDLKDLNVSAEKQRKGLERMRSIGLITGLGQVVPCARAPG